MTSQQQNPMFEYFHNLHIKDIVAEKKQELVTLKPTDMVETAVKVMSKNKILSAPVLNEKGELVGFVDMLDILKYIVKAAPSDWSIQQDALQSLKIAGRAIALMPISQAVDWTGREAAVVQINTTASALVKAFAKGFHRAVVFDKEKPVAIVSQSDLVRLLSQNLHMGKMKDIGTKSLKELGYSQAQVETAPTTMRVLDVLRHMVGKGVSQLAIVDPANGGRLVGNFSASDLRGLYEGTMPDLLMPAGAFLQKHSPNSLKPVCAVPSSSLVQLVAELVKSKLHHMWVIDEFKPVSVISLTDIMKISNE